MRPSRAQPLELNPSSETQPGLPRMALTPKLQPRCPALSLGLLGQCPHFASIAYTHMPSPSLSLRILAGQTDRRQKPWFLGQDLGAGLPTLGRLSEHCMVSPPRLLA